MTLLEQIIVDEVIRNPKTQEEEALYAKLREMQVEVTNAEEARAEAESECACLEDKLCDSESDGAKAVEALKVARDKITNLTRRVAELENA